MQHYRKTRKVYNSYLGPEICPFCDPVTISKTVKDYKHSYIINNAVKYDQWEGHDVAEHLLILPKRHVPHLKELGIEERIEIMDVIADYESRGYNVYARGVDSPRRSVAHQHTHLIKIHGKRSKFILFMAKPYLLVRR